MMRIRREYRSPGLRLLWVVSLIVVIVGSLLPDNSAPMLAIGSLGVSDKVQHCGAYAVLAFLPCLHERRRRVALLLMLTVAIGGLLELGQMLSPGRSCDVYDLLADTAGVIIGAVAGLAVRVRLAGFVDNNGESAAAELAAGADNSFILKSGK